MTSTLESFEEKAKELLDKDLGFSRLKEKVSELSRRWNPFDELEEATQELEEIQTYISNFNDAATLKARYISDLINTTDPVVKFKQGGGLTNQLRIAMQTEKTQIEVLRFELSEMEDALERAQRQPRLTVDNT